MQLRCTALPLPRARRSLCDPRKERWSLKLTRHNGRAGKHGTYNPKHNDRSFDLANSEHIDPERVQQNIYWDCYNGIRSALQPKDVDSLADTFEEVEKLYYKLHYTNFTERQNERNAKIRHTERNRSPEDLLTSKKTCPEESIYQLGTLESHASPKELFQIATEFMDEFHERFGKHVHILDWALHLDEGTPHIHERHVFDCENKYGEIAPQVFDFKVERMIGLMEDEAQRSIGEALVKSSGGILLFDEDSPKLNEAVGFRERVRALLMNQMAEHPGSYIIIYAEPRNRVSGINGDAEHMSDLVNVLVFEDYTKEELMIILKRRLEKERMKMTATARQYMTVFIGSLVATEERSHASSRLMRIVADLIVRNCLQRMAKSNRTSTVKEVISVQKQDVVMFTEAFVAGVMNERKRIGFI